MGSLDYLADIGLGHRSEAMARELRDRTHARALEGAKRGAAAPMTPAPMRPRRRQRSPARRRRPRASRRRPRASRNHAGPRIGVPDRIMGPWLCP